MKWQESGAVSSLLIAGRVTASVLASEELLLAWDAAPVTDMVRRAEHAADCAR